MTYKNSENKTISLLLYHLREIYGAERAALNLAKGFTLKGFNVDIVVIEKVNNKTLLEAVSSEFKVVELNVKDLRAATSTKQKLMALVKYLQQERPSALISFCDTINLATWSKFLSGVSTRIVIGVQNAFLSDSTSMKGLKKYLRISLIRLSYPWADGVVACSQGLAQDLANFSGLPSKSINFIYNPVITPNILKKAREPLDHPWFAGGEPPVILGVGRLHEQKDFSTLIKAFALLRKQKKSRLIILGEGHLRTQLEALVKELSLQEDVSLPGYVDNPYAYMAKAAVFVLSSAWEGFGNVLAEAIAVGTPAVSTDCLSGPAEILANGKYGKLVSVKDAKALSNAIIDTLDRSDRLADTEALKLRGLEFSTNKIVEQYLAVMKI